MPSVPQYISHTPLISAIENFGHHKAQFVLYSTQIELLFLLKTYQSNSSTPEAVQCKDSHTSRGSVALLTCLSSVPPEAETWFKSN